MSPQAEDAQILISPEKDADAVIANCLSRQSHEYVARIAIHHHRHRHHHRHHPHPHPPTLARTLPRCRPSRVEQQTTTDPSPAVSRLPGAAQNNQITFRSWPGRPLPRDYALSLLGPSASHLQLPSPTSSGRPSALIQGVPKASSPRERHLICPPITSALPPMDIRSSPSYCALVRSFFMGTRPGSWYPSGGSSAQGCHAMALSATQDAESNRPSPRWCLTQNHHTRWPELCQIMTPLPPLRLGTQVRAKLQTRLLIMSSRSPLCLRPGSLRK